MSAVVLRRAGLALLLPLLAAGCGGKSAPHAATATPSRAGIAVTSSIKDGARVIGAVRWEGTVSVDNGVPVEKVDFLIDGHVRWTEKNSPYVFDDDPGILPTWVLTPGSHRLSVRATTDDGRTAQEVSTVDVPRQTVTAPGLSGSYTRRVGPGDLKRVAPYRVASLGAFGDPSSLGVWKLQVGADGVMVLTQPDGGQYYEPYVATAHRFTMFGPAIWLQKDPDPSLFCEPESRSDYQVSGTARQLSFVPKQHACADRDMVVGGSWTRVG